MTQREQSTPEESHGRLADEHEAHLGFTTGHGRQHIVVHYALRDGRLVFQLPSYSSALGYTPDQPVTMEVPVHDDRGASSGHLLVSGTASMVDRADRGGADSVLDEHWPVGVMTCVLALPTTVVEHVRTGRPTDLVGVGAGHQTGAAGVAHAPVADPSEHQLPDTHEPLGPDREPTCLS